MVFGGDGESSAVFQIVETSSFKHIIHLSIKVEALSDIQMKKRLSMMALSGQSEISLLKTRLIEMRKDADSYAQTLTLERDSLSKTLDTISATLRTLTKGRIPMSDDGQGKDYISRLEGLARQLLDAQEASKLAENEHLSSKNENALLKGENSSLKEENSLLKENLAKFDAIKAELARKREILSQLESSCSEREERISALKAELRFARDAKVGK